MNRSASCISKILLAALAMPAALAPALAETAVLKIGDVKGESTDKDHRQEIAIESFSWGAAGDAAPPAVSADPDEGGEVTRKVPGLNKSADVTLKRGVMGSGAPVKPAIPTHEVTAPRDVATGQSSGKRQHEPTRMTLGSLTVLMPEGACIAGARYPAVTLQTDAQIYELQGVTVASCAPAATAKGKKDKAKIDYMIVTMETVLVTG